MKQIRIIVLLFLTISCSKISAQNIAITSEAQQKNSFDLDDLTDFLFEESDLFSERNFLWIDYQFLSNLAEKSSDTKTTIPMVGLHFERQLIGNFGARLSVGTNWWEEEVTLIESPFNEYSENFRFQYWTAGLGATWHFNADDSEKIDPYIGYMYSYRRIWATCDCISESNGGSTHDFFLGLRFFPSENFYLSLEFGRQGTGYIGTGLGFVL